MTSLSIGCLARLRFIPRWSIVPTVHSQSVADHSYNVTWIARWICEQKGYRRSGNFVGCVLNLALDHDKFEAVTGDAPSGVKIEGMPDPFSSENYSAEGNFLERIPVKLADYFDALLFLHVERMSGNQMVNDELHDVRLNMLKFANEPNSKKFLGDTNVDDLYTEFIRLAGVNSSLLSGYRAIEAKRHGH